MVRKFYNSKYYFQIENLMVRRNCASQIIPAVRYTRSLYGGRYADTITREGPLDCTTSQATNSHSVSILIDLHSILDLHAITLHYALHLGPF